MALETGRVAYLHRAETDEANKVNAIQVARAQAEPGIHHGTPPFARVEQARGTHLGAPDSQVPAPAHGGTDEAVLLE